MAIIIRATGTTARVEARSGDEVLVRLPENRTTGFFWELAGDHEVVANAFVAPDGDGAGGERVVTPIVGQSPASATFRLVRLLAKGEPERIFTLLLAPPADAGG